MNLMRCVFRGIFGKPGKNLVLAFLAGIFTLLVVVGFYLRSVSEQYEARLAEEYSAEIVILILDYQNCEDLLGELRDIPGAEDVDDSWTCSGTFDSKEPVVLSYHSSPAGYGVGFQLLEGSMPQENTREVIISTRFAEQYGMSMEDSLCVEISEDGTTVLLTVSGIYDTEEEKETVLICADSLKSACGDGIYRSISIRPDSAKKLSKLERTVRNRLGGRDGIKIHNTLQDAIESRSGIAEMLKNLCGIQIAILLVTAGVVFALVTLLWLRDQHRDAGLYLMLGYEQGWVIHFLLAQALIIVLAAAAVFSVIGYFLLQTYGAALIVAMSSGFGYAALNPFQELDSEVLNRSVSGYVLLQACGVVCLVTAAIVGVFGHRLAYQSVFQLFEKKN